MPIANDVKMKKIINKVLSVVLIVVSVSLWAVAVYLMFRE